jgi:REP element-mobilizing transposase RayT
MSVRREIPEYDGIYFITITCGEWLHLFEQANAYNSVYKWFDHLKSKRHFIVGYVIMPNHLHALLGFRNTMGESINRIIGTGKRFMAYGIVKGLQELNATEILSRLSSKVNSTDARRGKLHEVFEPSFEWKECRSEKFIMQKLNYIHENPCRGAWSLVSDLCDYSHGSAKYYLTSVQGLYSVTNFMELNDVDLMKPFGEGDRRVPETGDSAET